MSSHRYAYAHKLPKRICAGCGQKRLRTYIDLTTGEECDQVYGVCDRKNGCGYFRAPSTNKDDYQPRKQMIPPPIKRTNWRCPSNVVDATMQHNGNNVLLVWLESIFGAPAHTVWLDYRVGTYPPGRRTDLMYATCFWQIGDDQLPRSAKVIPYHDNGKRIKDMGAVWLHSIITVTPDHPKGQSMDELGIGQVLFGEHLLSIRPHDHVVVVESEKTALIGACAYPDKVWVATGGSNTFTVERCMGLSGRRVTVFPDCGMYEEWSEKAIDISLLCESMVVSDVLEAMGAEPGSDVGDYIACPMSPTEYFNYFEDRGIRLFPELIKAPEPVDPHRQRVDAWNEALKTTMQSPVDRILAMPGVQSLVSECDIDTTNVTIKPVE